MLPEFFAKLGLMGWPLLACSILTIAILLERLTFLLLIDGRGNRLLHHLQMDLNSMRGLPRDLRDNSMSLSLERKKRQFGRGINLLRLIAAVSPILGLLGTILGIIAAFQQIAASSDPVTPNMIADGLWEALLTTACGLLIALPALIFATLLGFWRQWVLDHVTDNLNTESLSFEIVDRTAESRQKPEVSFDPA